MRLGRAGDEPDLFRICFVCTGNICRSPMAETVFDAIAVRAGYGGLIAVMSAGTGDWHVGEPADRRTLAALAARGYRGASHRAKQFDPAWFRHLDLVVTFDRTHERVLRSWTRDEQDLAKIQPLLSFDPELAAFGDIPDPYYSDAEHFDRVLAMIERACDSLFRQIRPAIRIGA